MQKGKTEKLWLAVARKLSKSKHRESYVHADVSSPECKAK
jgi:hypothetical protein